MLVKTRPPTGATVEKEQVLKDIEAYYKIIQKYENSNDDEIKRISYLHKQKQKKLDLKAHLLEEKDSVSRKTNHLEADLHIIETKLSKSNKAISSVSTEKEMNTLNTQITEASNEKDKIEIEILDLYEGDSQLDKSLSEIETFISGINETISEIELEIDNTTIENNTKIEKLQVQIKGLFLELQPEEQRLFEIAQEKHGLKSAISHLKANSCSSCRISLSLDLVQRIKKKDLILCPSCSKLLLHDC